MIVRATSDLHVTPKTIGYVLAALAELRADAEAHPGFTVLAGDILDQPKTVHMPTYNRLREAIQDWPDQMIVIPGNHDQYDGWQHALSGLSSTAAVQIHSTPAVSDVGIFIPHVPDHDDFWDCVRMYLDDPDRSKVIFCHEGFKGAYMNTQRRDRDGYNLADLPSDLIFCAGHYHMPQNLGRLIYCGSPYECTFAEEGQAKGWLRWEDIHEDPVPVRVPYKSLGAPKHHTVRWDPEVGSPEVPDHADADVLRVVTTVARTTARRAAQQLVDAGLEAVPVLAQPDEASARGVVTAGMGVMEAAREYMLVHCPHQNADEMERFAARSDLWASL